MEPERSTALSDVHDTVDELGHLLNQRGKLVHHDDQARGSLGVPALLELDEVLGLLAIQDVLSVSQLGI